MHEQKFVSLNTAIYVQTLVGGTGVETVTPRQRVQALGRFQEFSIASRPREPAGVRAEACCHEAVTRVRSRFTNRRLPSTKPTPPTCAHSPHQQPPLLLNAQVLARGEPVQALIRLLSRASSSQRAIAIREQQVIIHRKYI